MRRMKVNPQNLLPVKAQKRTVQKGYIDLDKERDFIKGCDYALILIPKELDIHPPAWFIKDVKFWVLYDEKPDENDKCNLLTDIVEDSSLGVNAIIDKLRIVDSPEYIIEDIKKSILK